MHISISIKIFDAYIENGNGKILNGECGMKFYFRTGTEKIPKGICAIKNIDSRI